MSPRNYSAPAPSPDGRQEGVPRPDSGLLEGGRIDGRRVRGARGRSVDRTRRLFRDVDNSRVAVRGRRGRAPETAVPAPAPRTETPVPAPVVARTPSLNVIAPPPAPSPAPAPVETPAPRPEAIAPQAPAEPAPTPEQLRAAPVISTLQQGQDVDVSVTQGSEGGFAIQCLSHPGTPTSRTLGGRIGTGETALFVGSPERMLYVSASSTTRNIRFSSYPNAPVGDYVFRINGQLKKIVVAPRTNDRAELAVPDVRQYTLENGPPVTVPIRPPNGIFRYKNAAGAFVELQPGQTATVNGITLSRPAGVPACGTIMLSPTPGSTGSRVEYALGSAPPNYLSTLSLSVFPAPQEMSDVLGPLPEMLRRLYRQMQERINGPEWNAESPEGRDARSLCDQVSRLAYDFEHRAQNVPRLGADDSSHLTFHLWMRDGFRNLESLSALLPRTRAIVRLRAGEVDADMDIFRSALERFGVMRNAGTAFRRYTNVSPSQRATMTVQPIVTPTPAPVVLQAARTDRERAPEVVNPIVFERVIRVDTPRVSVPREGAPVPVRAGLSEYRIRPGTVETLRSLDDFLLQLSRHSGSLAHDEMQRPNAERWHQPEQFRREAIIAKDSLVGIRSYIASFGDGPVPLENIQAIQNSVLSISDRVRDLHRRVIAIPRMQPNPSFPTTV